ncbi:MAG: carboxypeptidase regulatory-like domain-containing protein, partial [Chloracidobacterium sp.]|nr:carboxypeptidase regulatory-like domain-containing protein [Chloracidobacterium sp.]
MKTNDRIIFPVSLLALLLVGFITPLALAQDITGSIVGLVKDSGGASIAGAMVTIKDTDKNVVVRTVTTNSEGAYSAPLLPVGHYSVTVEASNFKKFSRTNIELNVDARLTVDATLEVGQVTELVQVESGALQVELQTATQSGLISGAEVRELPLNNRNYLQLLTLMPGVSSGASDQLYIGVTNPFGQTNTVSFAIDGGRNSENNYTIDGADNIDRGSNLTLLNYPSVDAISEVKVLRNHYSAEYGRDAAGQVNVVTKSGTSQFHGGAYEFFRNDVLNANPFLTNRDHTLGLDSDGKAKRAPLRYNNFGYFIGGPVWIPRVYNKEKNKTFFFFSQEYRRVITYANFISSVPTAAERQGIFSNPVCLNIACSQTTTQITNIDPTAAAYIKDIYGKLPLPNAGTNTLNSSVGSVYNNRQDLLRIDHNFSEKFTVALRYLNDTIPTVEPGGLFTGNVLPGVATTHTTSPGRSWLVRGVQTITPSLINEVGYAYSYGAIISRNAGLNQKVNSPDINPTLPFATTLDRVPSISPGYSGISGFGPYNDFNRNHNIYDNVTKTLGKQTLKFGLSFHFYQKTENSGGNNVGSFSFDTGTTDTRPAGTTAAQQGWANFLLGKVSTFTQDSLDFTPDIHAKQFEFYFQDDFRLRPNLTINLGVRYSLFRQPYDAKGNLTNFDPNFYNPSKAFQIDANGNRVLGTGDPLNGIVQANGNSPFGNDVAPENNKNFAPVFGFAWDPFKDAKTSVRGGYGISYDTTLFGVVEQNIFANPPLISSVNISNTNFANPGSVVPNIAAAPLNLHGIPSDPMTPYVQQWSLDVQREVAKGAIIDVGYFGSKGTHLLGIVDLNLLPPGLAYASGVKPGSITSNNTGALLNGLRPYVGYSAINSLENWFNSNYNSLQVSAEKRFSGDSLIRLAYTWSHNLTDNQSDRSNAPQNPYDFKADYGPASLDRRQVLTINYIYDLPFFRKQEGVAGHILGGWQLSGITTYASGNPLTVTTGSVDPAGLGFLGASASGPRPDLVADPNANAPHTFAQWFNTSAFTNVAAGVTRPGDAGRGV